METTQNLIVSFCDCLPYKCAENAKIRKLKTKRLGLEAWAENAKLEEKIENFIVFSVFYCILIVSFAVFLSFTSQSNLKFGTKQEISGACVAIVI